MAANEIPFTQEERDLAVAALLYYRDHKAGADEQACEELSDKLVSWELP